MMLTSKQKKKLKSMTQSELLEYTVKIHLKLRDNQDQGVIDIPLENKAKSVHLFMFSHVPAIQFKQYVENVNTLLGRPFWMSGYLGCP